MDLGHYVDLMEQSREPEELERIRDQILEDGALSPSDKQFLTGRVGMYLADVEREQADPAGRSPEHAPDEEG